MKGKTTDYIKSLGSNDKKAVGGVKVILQHCLMLREQGINAVAVHMGRYKGEVFGLDIHYINRRKARKLIRSDDIVVASEFAPYDIYEFKSKNNVLFMQSIRAMTRLKEEHKNLDYFQIGFKEVITCSDFCTSIIKQQMGIEATTVTNGIDTTAFTPNLGLRKEKQVLLLTRKHPEDIEKIKKLASGLDFNFVTAEGLTQEELVCKYQESDIFVPTGYPEGFGLTPLEAMLCGCVVVGFTGGGAQEFMIHNETALVASDGDCVEVVRNLDKILNDKLLKERIRENGYKIAKSYTTDRTAQLLTKFFKDKFPGLIN